MLAVLCFCFALSSAVSLAVSEENRGMPVGNAPGGGFPGAVSQDGMPGDNGGFPGSPPKGGMPPQDGMPAGGMPGGAGLTDLAANSGINIKDDQIEYDTPSIGEGRIVASGAITPDAISSVMVEFNNIGDWGSGTTGQSGIVINSPGKIITVGGDDDVYTVDGAGYNSVITLDALDGDTVNTLRPDGKTRNAPLADSEMIPGIGLAFSAKKIFLNNIYIKTDGHNRSAILTKDSVDTVLKNTTLISTSDSWIFPLFICIHRGARTALLTSSGDTWCYNTKIYSSNWGTYSLDGCNDVDMYIVNSYSENTDGGYGLFPLGMGDDYERAGNNNIYVYGSKMVSAQYGMIFCDAPNLLIDSMDHVSSKAMSEYGKDSNEIHARDYITKDGKSLFAGAVSAAVITFDMNARAYGTRFLGCFDAMNSVFSTAKEDLVDEKGNALNDQLNVMGSELVNEDTVMGGMGYFAMKYVHGDVFWIRGASIDMNLEKVDLRSSSGVLFHSTVDMTNWNFSNVPDGTATKNINIELKDMKVKGDIVHDDYQREMNVKLVNASLEGAAIYATVTGWNEKIATSVENNWKDAQTLKEAYERKNGADSSQLNKDTVLKNLVLETDYSTVWGLAMSIDAKSTWTVTDTSRLASLTIDKGAKIKAPPGCRLNMTVDGIETKIKAGVYKNVVITISKKQ